MHAGVVEKLMQVLGSKNFERTIHEMYVDKLGLVTVGIGFLLKTAGDAKKLAFTNKKTLKRASAAEIEAEWKRTNALGSGANRIVPNPTLEISNMEIEREFRKRANQFEHILKTRAPCCIYFGKLDDWPADAQLGLLAMSWSGPYKIASFVNFRKACKSMEFDKAAKESHMRVREQYNRFFATCFKNASDVMKTGASKSVLRYK
jgi:hypothetical protein